MFPDEPYQASRPEFAPAAPKAPPEEPPFPSTCPVAARSPCVVATRWAEAWSPAQQEPAPETTPWPEAHSADESAPCCVTAGEAAEDAEAGLQLPKRSPIYRLSGIRLQRRLLPLKRDQERQGGVDSRASASVCGREAAQRLPGWTSSQNRSPLRRDRSSLLDLPTPRRFLRNADRSLRHRPSRHHGALRNGHNRSVDPLIRIGHPPCWTVVLLTYVALYTLVMCTWLTITVLLTFTRLK